MTMQAVILAGGKGKRIYPLGITKPKSMFEIMGKPLLQFIIENLIAVGIRDICIVTGPEQDQIRGFLNNGDQFGVRIHYTIQAKSLGQANAIQTTEQMIENDFFVLNANDIFDSSLLIDMANQAELQEASLVLAGRRVDEPWRFGVMGFDGERLTSVVEKPPKGKEPSRIGVVGVYYFSPEIFRYIRDTPKTDSDDQLERAYQKMIDEGKATHVSYSGIFESYKHPWDLLKISGLILSRGTINPYISPSADISPHAIVGDNVIIDDNVRIFENAIVRGPAFIGANSIIGNNVLIWGGCSLGQGCVIGYGSEIKHSVFGRNVWTHRSYVGDSIVADDCSFGAGSITANRRFDDSNIWINVQDKRVDTGSSKFGTIMAEGCRTGSNSVLMPGVKIGPNSIVGPGVTLMQDLPPNKIALSVKNAYRIRDNRLDLVEKSYDDLLDGVRQNS